MPQTYTRGTLLWVDDGFSDQVLPAKSRQRTLSSDEPQQKWRDLFGSASDQLFRLMDLSLEIACSYEEAITAIANCTDPQAAGTFVFTILDLSIPRGDSRPAVKHGIEVAEELRRRELPFVFLSAKTDATAALDQAGLGTVPYYVKEPSGGAWRLPDSLAQNVLSEFRRKISWVSLADIVAIMHRESDIVGTHKKVPEAFEYFPFFGPYGDFVQRREYKDRLDVPSAFVVTATVEHSDEFVQQALSLMLNQRCVRNPGGVRFHYGQAHKREYLGKLRESHVVQDPDTICAIRIWPAETTVEELRDLLHEAGRRAGTTVFVVPNDEWADKYTELLRQFHIPTIEEVPQTPWGDAAAREELVKRTCALVFQQWSRPAEGRKVMPLPRGYLAHPELLINPIDWIALQEAHSVARELSDPYEITKELLLATHRMSAQHHRDFHKAVTRELPLPYRRLLCVGREALRQSKVAAELPAWIERALDMWLNTSWHFPYGLGKQFAQLQHAENNEEAWRGRNWEAWEDSCYEVLVGMLAEYDEYRVPRDRLTDRQADLARVRRFVHSLGGAGFLTGSPSAVDWESLESFRWPHHRYPMPAAINRRLKQAGRYLWIQPEGLDTALSLPRGRLRYRFLSDMVEQYSSALQWGRAVAPKLPLGWQSSVGDLVQVIRDNRVAETWHDRDGRARIWHALLGLVRNAAPIMLIADWALRGKRLAGMNVRESAEKFLKKSKGSGTILSRIRSPRAAWRHGCLVNTQQPVAAEQYLRVLREVSQLLAAAPAETGVEAHGRATELGTALANLLTSQGRLPEPPTADQPANPPTPQFAAIKAFTADGKLGIVDPLECWSDRPSREILKTSPVAMLESLFKTKGDYLWHMLDTLAILEHLSYPYRHFDGYHLLATINDLRIVAHDTLPKVEVPVIERVLDLFVAALEGLIAQLAWCVKLAGHDQRAAAIAPSSVSVQPPDGFEPPRPRDLAKVLGVVETPDSFAVGTLGSPVGGIADRLVYHEGGEAILIDNLPAPSE